MELLNQALASVVVASLRVEVLLARPVPHIARKVRSEIAVVEVLPPTQWVSLPVLNGPDVLGVSTRCAAKVFISRRACHVVPVGVRIGTRRRRRRRRRGCRSFRQIPAAVAPDLRYTHEKNHPTWSSTDRTLEEPTDVDPPCSCEAVSCRSRRLPPRLLLITSEIVALA